MKKFKSVAILLVLLLTLFVISACSPNNDEQPNESEIQDPISDSENNTNTEEPTGEEPTEEDKADSPETIEKTGTYVGLMDSNSCEITIDGNPTPFRLSEDVKSVIDGINPNEEVKISYYENEYEQLVLTHIEKAE